jgi:hypothetical protein
VPSSDDDDCQSAVSTSFHGVLQSSTNTSSILQLPVAKKSKKDATVFQALHSITKAEKTASNSTSEANATQEFALITQVSFVIRTLYWKYSANISPMSQRCLNLEPKQSFAIKTSSASKFKRSDKVRLA